MERRKNLPKTMDEERAGMKGRLKTLARPAAVTALIWAVLLPLVTSGNIRMDSERMFHTPQIAMDQYVREGRSALVWLLRLFGLTEWNPVRSGILFLLFLSLACWMLWAALRRFRAWKDTWYPELFLLLYGLSPIWAYHGYFTLQIAAIGFGILLATGTACADARFMGREKTRPALLAAWNAAAAAVLCFTLLIYQSLIVCYAAALLTLIFCRRVQREPLRRGQLCLIVLRAAAAVAGYLLISQALRGDAGSGNLAVQIHWGKDNFTWCLYRMMLEAGATVLMYTSRYFSLYTLGLVLMIVLWVRRRKAGEEKNTPLLLCGVALAAAPFAMTVLLGNVTVPRSQFALQMAGAFFPVCFMAVSGGRQKALKIVCIAAAVIQVVLTARLIYTDNKRNETDTRAAAVITEELKDKDKPLVFVGVLRMEDTLLTERSDVFGRTFFEWNWHGDDPTAATHPAIRLLTAYDGGNYRPFDSGAQAAEGAAVAADMPAYPADGFIREEEGFIVIKLSE